MHSVGQSPATIATSLGIDIATIDSYLNISVPVQTVVTATAAPQAPAAPAVLDATTGQSAPVGQVAPAQPNPAATPVMTGRV
jgi:hypothetical protein